MKRDADEGKGKNSGYWSNWPDRIRTYDNLERGVWKR